MTLVEAVLRFLVYGTAAFTILFCILSVLAARRFKNWSDSASVKNGEEDFLPPVTILKPIKDVERGMYPNLASFLSQDYPQFQVLFSIQNPEDPALEILERLRREFPNVDMEIIVSKNRIGYNPKINNIANAYTFAKYDLIMISDSDVHVERSLLRRVVAPMADPRVGLVTCLYRAPDSGPSLGSTLEALSINAHFLPKALVAGILLGLRFAMGAVMLVRRSALEASGGLSNLSGHLADDYILGHSVMAAGYQLAFCNAIVDSLPSVHSFSETLSHLVRWARTIRVCQPLGYLGLILLYPLPLLVLYLLLFGPTFAMMTTGLVVIASRCWSIFWIHRRYLDTPQILPQIPWIALSDLLQFSVWILGFRSGSVLWRGEHYDIAVSGRLVPSKDRIPSRSERLKISSCSTLQPSAR